MTPEEYAKKVLDDLVAMSPEDRVNVMSDLRWNDVFCISCGWGSKEHPNASCQCQNDE